MNAHPPRTMVNTTTGVPLPQAYAEDVENHPPGGNSESDCEAATATAESAKRFHHTHPSNTTTNKVDLVYDGEYYVENHPPGEHIDYESAREVALTEAALRVLAVKKVQVNNRMPRGGYAKEESRIKYISNGTCLKVNMRAIRARAGKLKKEEAESEFDAAVDELVKRGMEAKEQSESGSLPYGWLRSTTTEFNKQRGETLKKLTEDTFRYRLDKGWGKKYGITNNSAPPPNTVQVQSSLTSVSLTIPSLVIPLPSPSHSHNKDFVFEAPSTCLENAVCIQNSVKPVSTRIATPLRDTSSGTPEFDLRLDTERQNRRRSMKLQKYSRKSLSIANSLNFPPLDDSLSSSSPTQQLRSSLGALPFNGITKSAASSPILSSSKEGDLIHSVSLVTTPTQLRSSSDAPSFGSISESAAFYHLLSYLNEGDLVSASLVSTIFADFAAVALGAFMLKSVGCSSSKDWKYLMHQFPWARYLGDGGCKRVYKVWNSNCRAYEAISVMDLNEINGLGNLIVVHTELAVSVMLSSLTKRGICPNFVLTRGVFTCQYEPPASFWGCRDDHAPNGDYFDGRAYDNMPVTGDPGNYQYIRMELCDHGDVEGFIRKHPDKMLTPFDCRNLLFQMAFALHIAAERFSLKHYDVKLLNLFLQSATDSTIAIDEHPHVVLRYGVGSNIFRLRMHPSTAYIAKLADYGTVVIGSDMDGKPIGIGQFTTLENTPPDYLILGNAAEQGGGHDSFGLGLCMFHLFTGYCPYEEILNGVYCPERLKGKLRSIWTKKRSYDVIRSVMRDSTGLEDQTLYDTLYRFLVLFGIPEHQFLQENDVWRAINSTLNSRRLIKGSDREAFIRAREKYSLSDGTDKRIAGARRRLSELDGAMELLLALVSFDPDTRATPLDVINSRMMAELIEKDDGMYCEDDIVKSYTALAK